MPETCANCNGNPVEIARTTPGTPTVKLIAILVANGITDNRELAAITGLAMRSVQHARATHCAQPIAQRNPLRDEAQPIAPDATHCAQPIAPLARAYKESSSKILITEKQDSTPCIPHGTEKPASATAETTPARPRLRTARGTRLGPDWQLPDAWRMWARTIFPAATPEAIDDQAAQFRDYWIAKPGAMACKLDWEATWRNWCRKGLSPTGHVRRPQSTGVFQRPKIDWQAALKLAEQEEARRAACV